MKKIAVVFCVVFSFAAAGLAQTARRTVTNADLAKFQTQRVEAERQYRETYAAKGMLSPDELNALSDARVRLTLQLADKLRSEELDRRRLAVEAAQQQLQLEQMRQINSYPATYYPVDGSIWGYGVFDNGSFGNGRFRGRRFPGAFGQGWYAAGGNVWRGPIGSISQRPQRAFRFSNGPRGRH